MIDRLSIVFVLHLFLLPIYCFSAEKLFFLHVPKSGGITFRSLLQDRYPIDRGTNFVDWNAFDPNVKYFEDFDLVTGHLLYSHVKNFCADFKKVTILRDPVARVLSEHRYIFNRNHKNPSKVLGEHFLPLQGDPIETAENVACKFLSQLDPFDPTIPIEKHLESAMNTLACDFDFVGILEEMDASISLFFNLLDWEIPEIIPVHNTTDSTVTNYSEAILNEIAERNWADIKLYLFAKELFEMKKKDFARVLGNEIIQWTHHIHYHFNESLDGFGWCPREEIANTVFRWLDSSEKGAIKFPLISGPNYFLQAEIYIKHNLFRNFSISVNGARLSSQIKPIEMSSDEYGWYLFSAVIPSRLIETGKKTRVEFEINDRTRIPSRDSYRGRGGSRGLSIAPLLFQK